MLTLDTPPPGVTGERWAGEAATGPSVGDLWLLSWDGEALALAVISGVGDGFALCWPVTFADAPVFAPAATVGSTPLGVPLLAWPTRETGVGLHLLHRRFGTLMSERTMTLVLAALDDDDGGTEFPLPLAARTVEGNDAEGESDRMVELWEHICLNVWPRLTVGVSPFNADALRRLGIAPGQLADMLGTELATAVSLYRGESAPTVYQVLEVAGLLRVEPEMLLDAGTDAGARLLTDPQFKEPVLALSRERGLTEGAARDLVRSEFALAARADREGRGRLQATIDRLRAHRSLDNDDFSPED